MSDSTTTVAAPAAPGVEEIRDEMTRILDAQRKLCHNINNPLTAIMGRAQILQLKQGTDPQILKVVEVIEESAKRVAHYVRELSDLIHQGRDVISRE